MDRTIMISLTPQKLCRYAYPMHELAAKLNRALAGTIISDLFSEFGRRIYFPKGIAAQAAEASEFATRYDATIGMAKKEGLPMVPEATKRLLPELDNVEAVAYAPNGGVSDLRELWSEEIRRKNPSLAAGSFSKPTVVAGLSNGIAQTADLFIDPGDAVCIPVPHWSAYQLIFGVRRQGVLKTFPFYSHTGGFNLNGLREIIAENSDVRKLAIVFNFPNNPTGYSLTIDEALSLKNMLVDAADSGLDILVICDDAYFGLFFEKEVFKHSFFSLIADAHPRILAVKVDGASKEDFAWGFRIGFVTVGTKGLSQEHFDSFEQKLLGSIRSSISNCSRPAQSVLLRALREPGYADQKRQLHNQLEHRYREVKRVLAKNRSREVLRPLPFNSGYFMSFACGVNAESLRTDLLKGKGIGTIAISDDVLRVAYAGVDDEVIEPLFEEIYDSAEKLSRI